MSVSMLVLTIQSQNIYIHMCTLAHTQNTPCINWSHYSDTISVMCPETLPGLGSGIKYLYIFSSFLLTTERRKAKSAKGKGRLMSEKTRVRECCFFSLPTHYEGV